MNKTAKQEDAKIAKLTELYKKAASLNEELPKELMDKLSIYGQILEILGGMWAAATKDWKLAEAKRREAIATHYSLNPEGTTKDKEMQAEMAAAEWRRKEAEYEAEALRWKAAYIATQEQIQILKKKYEHLKEVAKGGI
ncbi:hypothetical protein H839_08224 [Parageobacillus genomosp. 1]|uniref:Phage protein n=1 Tax=Parageobacillus genomosp. 1 TaxID=1295642 RepID=A0ABC9VGP0_9BACL|nr:hypothetical protein [Parageobacillus genomosp. 1]EZP77604.1 hypothetical protein H839_08224 [Parageobacillus genomosp. 1]